ncbi:DNL zinc finger-domain-containing protein [Biscogniauxia mediterranea]|nr:DNL zinc finger-domain-containing protein [Biscogniauxia mediterranea]
MMRSKAAIGILNPILRPSRTLCCPPPLRPFPRLPRTSQPAARRFAHAIPKPPSKPSSSTSTSTGTETKPRKLLEPHYELRFTCVPCSHRSTHIVSKQGYHKGTVLITCPECRNRHIISDHLKIFGDRKITIEDLMREKGQLVKRGTLGEDGDVEFWEDGTTTQRSTRSESSSTPSTEEGGEVEEKKEEEATTMRDTRDPSSYSTDPAPSTGSTSLGNAGTRPSVDSPTPSHIVPSTRRQYHIDASNYIESLNERDKKFEERQNPRPAEEPQTESQAGDPEDAGDSSYIRGFRKIDMGGPLTRAQSRRLRQGWRAPESPYSGRHPTGRSPATRISYEELQELKNSARRRESRLPDPSQGSEFLSFVKVPVGGGRGKVEVDPESGRAKDPRVPKVPPAVRVDDGQLEKTPQVKFVNSTHRFNGIRLISIERPDKKPLWIRPGPNNFYRQRRPPGGPRLFPLPTSFAKPIPLPESSLSELDKLEHHSRASSDLWGDKNLTKKMRSVIDKFIDNGPKSSF